MIIDKEMKQALLKLLDSYHRKQGVRSMSASLLYHTNQIENVQVNDVEYFSEKVVFHAFYAPKDVACPCCGHAQTTLKGKKIRKLRMAPMGSKPAWLSVEIHRLECRNCLHIEWPKMPFVRGKKRVTRSFEQYVINLMSFSTIKHVANFLDCSWDLVKEIHKDYLNHKFIAPNLKLIRYVGIDEFSISKGHKYMTIFIDLETGVILHAVEGKSINSVTPFMLELKEQAPQLKAMAMDMNAAYASAVKECLPNVDVVYDRFHVVALLNTAIDEIRRDQQTKCDEVGLKTIKGMRFLLLKNYEMLEVKTQKSLQTLLEANMPIALAHTMKEQIRLFWMKKTVKDGARYLGWWIMDAIESGVSELQKAGRTLLRHWKGVINYFSHPITNGKTEGINNKIKTMKRQAYGFRDMEYFKLRLYSLHECRYSFPG